jgi:hypothetical protein
MSRSGLLTVLLLLGTLAQPAPAQIRIQWKFKEGDTFYVQETISTRQTEKLRGSVLVQELEQTRVSRFRVLKVMPDGGAVLEQKLESVQATPHGAGVQTQAAAVRRLAGATLRITLDGHQRVVKIEGFQKLVDDLARADEDAARIFRALVTEAAVRRPAELLLGFTPEGPVLKGDSWQVKSAVPFGPLGTLHLVDTYTLEGPESAEKDLVKVTLKSTATYSPPEKAAGVGLPFKIQKGDVKVKEALGSLLFNLATGRLVQSERQRDVQGVLVLAPTAHVQLEMEVEQRQKTAARVFDTNPLQK